MKISVVMPCYNASAWIGIALRSLLNQTLVPTEIIVVDDGSSDDSAAIAERFGPPVQVLRVANAGASAARIRGADMASGDALMFMDADDLIQPDTLAAQAACLRDNPDTIALAPWRRYQRLNATVWLAQPASCPPRRDGQDDLQAWLSGWYHPPCAVLWSRRAFERSGGWDPDITVNDDGDVMMRGLVRGNRLVLSREGSGFYRRIPGEAQTLSGGRSTRDGVTSRLRVIERIASMLESEQRIVSYAGELRTSYRSILETCPEEFTDLRERMQTLIAKLPAARHQRIGGKLDVCTASPDPSDKSLWKMPRPVGLPAVSVVIPTYNRAQSVCRALDSVLTQDHTDLEVIVVDDASTDNTAQIVRQIPDNRIRLVEQPVNQGVSAARNRGIAEARAPLIALLDSDDVWLPGKLSRQIALMDASPANVGLIYTGIENRIPDGAKIFVPSLRGDVFASLLRVNKMHGCPSTALIRREVFDMVGNFDTTYPAIEDYEMWVRIARFWRVDFIPEPLAAYFDAAEDDAAGLRRSRNLRANNDAREMFHARYSDDMRRAGTEPAFVLESARRRASEGPIGRLIGAKAILKTLRQSPKALELYGWLAVILLPPRIRNRIVNVGVKSSHRAAQK